MFWVPNTQSGISYAIGANAIPVVHQDQPHNQPTRGGGWGGGHLQYNRAGGVHELLNTMVYNSPYNGPPEGDS